MTIASFCLLSKTKISQPLLCSGEINLQRAPLRLTMINTMNELLAEFQYYQAIIPLKLCLSSNLKIHDY